MVEVVTCLENTYMMGKHKHLKPCVCKKFPKDSIEPSLEDQLEATEKFIYEVLELFDDLQKILDKKDND